MTRIATAHRAVRIAELEAEVERIDHERCAIVDAAQQTISERDEAQAQLRAAQQAQWMTLPDEDGEGGLTWRMAFADHDMLLKDAERQLRERDEAHERHLQATIEDYLRQLKGKDGQVAALRSELLELVQDDDSTLADQVRDLVLNLDEGILGIL